MLRLLKRMVYPSINRLLLFMMLLLVPALLLIAQDVELLTMIPVSWIDNHQQLYSLLLNVAISYLVSILFYVVQVHIPQRAVEKKAFSVLNHQLDMLVENERFIQQASELNAEDAEANASIVYSYPKTRKNRNQPYTQRIESAKQENMVRILEINYHLYDQIQRNTSFSALDRSLIDLIQGLYIEDRYNSMCSKKLIQDNRKLHETYNLDIEVVENSETISKAIQTLSDVYCLANGKFFDSHSRNDRSKSREGRFIARLTANRK